MIYIIFAPPGSGKSYYGAWLTITEHRRRKSRYKWFFTNYYMYDKKLDWSPYIWKKELARQPITDSLIVIDEAWQEGLNSRKYKDFDEQPHAFYATCRHQNNDIYILTQAVARVEIESVNLLLSMYLSPAAEYPLRNVLSGLIWSFICLSLMLSPAFRCCLPVIVSPGSIFDRGLQTVTTRIPFG